MQTFLPYKDFDKTAKCLDNKRLGKQRVEAYQILVTILENKKAWRNHPAVNMWRGYEPDLVLYGLAMCKEWIKRGYHDTLLSKFKNIKIRVYIVIPSSASPKWITNNFIRAHRSNLLRKDKKYYSKFKWNVPDNLPYIWPTKLHNSL